MIWLLIPAIWFLGLRLLPVTLWRDDLDANGRNWPGLVVIRKGLPAPGAVWAQEFFEARHKWRRLPLLFLIPLGRRWSRFAGFERRMELMGHEIEVWAEHLLIKNPVDLTRAREARAMVEQYRVLADWTPEQVRAAMEQNRDKAQEFVTRHERRIREAHEKGIEG